MHGLKPIRLLPHSPLLWLVEEIEQLERELVLRRGQ